MDSNKTNILVTKGSGEQAEFSREKLQRSLERSGASAQDVQRIVSEIEKILYPEMPTHEIYKRAFKLLRQTSRPLAAKYKLKNALLELGPSGFPFEKYVAEILKHQGYSVQVGQIVKGNCVTHEIDVISEKDKERIMVECKFHSEHYRKCNIKIPLYIYARYLDIEKQWIKNTKRNIKLMPSWIVTNTQFSSDAMKYASCTGLYLLSWNYPKGEALKERIDSTGLHPLTCLTTLTGREKQTLLEQGVVLAKSICHDEKILFNIGIKGVRAKNIQMEAHGLCIE